MSWWHGGWNKYLLEIKCSMTKYIHANLYMLWNPIYNFNHFPLLYATNSKSCSILNPYVVATNEHQMQITFFQLHIFIPACFFFFLDKFQLQCSNWTVLLSHRLSNNQNFKVAIVSLPTFRQIFRLDTCPISIIWLLNSHTKFLPQGEA